ncbi:MAG: endonuclease [Firmicutes bacterium]|nr:endonuclease [Bacillota bacterium]
MSIYQTTDFRSYTTKQSGQVTRFFKAEASAFSVTASASPVAGGTVKVEGNTITATPNDGYYVTGDFVADDGIEVTYHNDNTFTFTATADGEVLIEFAAKPAATLTYSENGATHNASGTYYVGDSVTLADPVNAAPATYTFMGWLPSTYATNDTAPAGLLKVGDSYTLSAADNTLYAVYAIAGEGGAGDGSTFKKVTAEKSDWSGTYVIADKNSAYVLDYATSSTAGNATTIASSGITLTDDVMTNVAEQYTVTLGKTGDNYYVQLNGATDAYLTLTSNSNTVSRGSSYSATSGQWTVTWDTDGVHLFSANYTTRELQKNSGNAYFRCYTGTQTDIVLYEQQGGTSYSGYTTTVNTEATYYTLTYSSNPADGGSITCDSTSGASIEEGELVGLTAVAAEHYTFSNWTVTGISAEDYVATDNSLLVTMSNDVTVVANFTAEPTYTVTINQVAGGTMEACKVSGIFAGETITLTATPDAHYSFGGWQVVSGGASITGNSFTMPASNVVITGSFVEDAQYTVTYYDKDGHVCATKTYYDGETILASDVPSVEAPDGFVFKDWYSTTYNGTDAPAYTAPAGTTVNGNLEFHAVYAELGEGGTSSNSFTLVTDNSQLVAGNQYLLGYASNRTDGTINIAAPVGTDTFLNRVTETAASGVIALSADSTAQIFTLGGSEGAWTLTGTTDGMLGASSSNAINTNATNNTTWNITVASSGAATIASVGLSGRYLQYNSTSPRFACYNGNQQTPSLYVCGASISGYTTNPVSTKITVTWMNGTDVFKTEKVAYGDAIVAPDTNPEKTEEEQQYFTFAGWSESAGGEVITSFPTASAELGDKTYYAVYTTVSKLTVTWKNYDGTPLATEYYKAGETPTYKGSDPTRPSDSSFYYTFSGWDPKVSSVTASITYTATFTQHDRFELTASLSKDTVKVSKSAKVNYTLTDMGTATTAFTPSFSVGNSAIASVDANGKITAKAVGSTTVTITFPDAHDAEGNPISKTLNLTVIENTSLGGYTLMTQANSPIDWSGEYIFMARAGGKLPQLNDLWIMTPKWNEDGSAIVEDGNSIHGSSTDAANNASHIDGLTITDGEATGTIDSAYTTGDEISMVATGDNDFTIGGTDYTVLDQITEIPDGYAFEIELVDDVNMYYTIRVKGTSYYLANNNTEASGNNGLYYAVELTDGDTKPLWTIRWATAEDGLTSTAEGYTPDQVMIESVYSTVYNRDILFNPMEAAATSNSRFRVYGENAYNANGNLGASSNNGMCYNLFLYGNPNPFSAQISYNGDQVTLTQHAEVQVGVPSITLDGALLPDIATEPNWSLVSGPTWSIVSTSTSGTMSIDADTGAMTFSGVSADDYAIVGLSYVVHDDINNVNHTVSTQGMVVIIPTSDTYTGIAFEQASGKETETSYTVKYTVNQLPLDFYVKSDSDLTTVYNDGRTSTGTYTINNSGMSWNVAISSGGGSGATASISNDGDGSATLNMSGFTEDAILTVTVSNVVANGKTVPDFTYKVYVKYVAYTVDITHDGGQTGDFSVSPSTTSVPLDKTVTNAAGETPADGTFTTGGGTWAIVGNANGATINATTGLLDLSGCDRSEEFTLQIIVSGVSATTTPSDGSDPVTTTGLYNTVNITVQAETVDFRINDDTVVVDYDRSVTIDVLANDSLNGLTVTALTASGADVTVNADNTLTYTPSGWIASTVSFTYTVTLSNGGSASATVNIVPAESVYYEDSNNVFTYTNGQRGEWKTDGTEAVQAQTSSLTSSDIYGYDTNYDSASCAKYSAGQIHMVNVSANNNFSYSARDPYVTFTFVGTGFDVICLNSNETGAVMVRVLNNDTGKYVVSKVIDTFRGYNYSTDAVEVVGYTQYVRYMKNADGTYTMWDGSVDPTEYVYILHDGVTDTGSDSSFTRMALSDFYTKNADGTYTQDNSGTYVRHITTTNWVINTGLDGDTSAMYQVPLIRETGLGYGTYTVTVTAVYNAVFDYNDAGDYDMYFDAVRIYDPINKGSEYTYHSIRDELIEDDAFGNGSATPCTHETLGDWEFNTKATYTSSATTNGRGSFVKRCTQCGKICETDYFYVTATADNTELDSQEANSLPATTTLHYTITSDNAEIQAMLNALTFDEYWRSSNETVFTCKNFSSSVRANGAGKTYATLQLSVGTGEARVIYASAIHTPDITVTGCSHTWTTKTTAATCQSEGSTTYTCSVCGYTYSVTLPKVDHSYTYKYNETQHWGVCIWCGTTTTAENHSFTAEVTESGITYTCNVCGYSYTQSTTCGHANTYLSGYVAATCTTAGYTGDTVCSDCGDTIAYGETIPATGHSYGDWTHDDATSEASSTHSKTCANCGDVVTEACSFTDVVTPPTTSSQGYTTHTCSVCGYSYKDNYTDPTSAYTVTYYVNGSVVDSLTQSDIEDGTAVTLAAAQDVSGYRYDYKFLGWVGTTVNDTEETQTYANAGDSFTVTGNTAFHALYSYAVAGEGIGTQWELVEDLSTVTAGTYALLTTDYHAFNGTISSSGHGGATTDAFVFTDGIATSAPDGTVQLTLTASGNGYTVYNADNGYLYIKAASSGNLAWSTIATSYWTFSSDNMYYAGVTNARLRSYNNGSFRTYGTNNGSIMVLAKLVGSSTTYFTTTLQAPCTHTDTTIETVEATCTTAGYAKEVCNDCGVVVDYVEVEALGHNYGSATNTGNADVHTYTCTREGCGDSYTEAHAFTTSVNGATTTYTCDLCGYSYEETASYTLTYLMPTGQTAPETATGSSVTLATPTTTEYTDNNVTYTFVGWVEETVTPTDSAPTIYQAGSTYPLSADTNLFACYTYVVTSGGSGDWTLVTDASTLAAGDQLLIASNTEGCVAGDIESSVMTNIAATFASGYSTVTKPDGAVALSLGGSSGAWTLANASGQLLGATAAKKLAWDSGTTTWSISISGNNATIQNGTSTYGRFLYNVSSPRFTTYTSGTGTNMLLPQLYRQSGSGTSTTTTYYTTVDAKVPSAVTYTVELTPSATQFAIGENVELTAVLKADGVAVTDTTLQWRWLTSQSTIVSIDYDSDYCIAEALAVGQSMISAICSDADGNELARKGLFLKVTDSSTSTGDQPTSYSKTSNSGTRGVTCTTLGGTYADSYYTGSYTYENLSSQTGSTLLNTLQNLMTSTHSKTTTYDDCKTNAYKTDCQNGDGTVVLLYTSYAAAQSDFSASAPGWNREHVWPQSLGGFSTSGAGADMHHIRPDDVTTNSKRGNNKYGEVTSGTEATGSTLVSGMSGGLYGGGYFEPLDNVKGDVARICLYVYTRYNGSYTGTSDITNVFSDIDTLLSWCELDPVDTWEMGRNVVVENTQGNRNVFIDYPELAWNLFDRTVPSGMITPSGNAASTAGTASAVSTMEVAERSATRADNANYSGAAFIDGIGNTSSVEEMQKYGPKNEVYLAQNQAIVFYLVGENAIEHLQIGAKAANGTAHIKITALNGPDTIVLDKELVTATEMYYEFGSGIEWNSGVSSAIVIENTGSGVLSITNLRYLTADGSLAFYVNSSAVAQSKLLLATGSSIPETDPELPGDDITPTDPTTPSEVPTESTEPETSSEPETPTDPVTPADPEPTEPETPTDPVTPADPEPTEPVTPADPEPAEPEVKIEQFKDVSESDWFYDGVKYAVESGLMKGVSEEDFAPDDTLTRAMLVTILYRLAGSPAVDENAKLAFTDVEDGQWYTDAILWATEEGITHGITETTFGTNDPVTREQMVTFLWRYVGEPKSEQSLDHFPDADRISSFAETAMRWAVENGIITGNEMNGKAYIDPQGNATRAQIAVIFMRSEKTLD